MHIFSISETIHVRICSGRHSKDCDTSERTRQMLRNTRKRRMQHSTESGTIAFLIKTV